MKKEKMKGKWIDGEYWALSSAEMNVRFAEAGKGVKKPTAVEQKGKKWRIYHKPIGRNEFWD